MSSPAAALRVRRMSAADLHRVVEIGMSLQQAPRWPASAYGTAINPLHRPRRIAVVAELEPEEQTSGAKAPVDVAGLDVRAEALTLHRTSFSAAGDGAPFRNEGFGPASGRIVGFAVAGIAAPEAELETIAVIAEGQRRGVGGQLLKALAEELRTEQVTVLMLEVRASNREARGFYRAQGFQEIGRRPRYYADPEEDAVLMRLNLV
jgi:ribosomal-protein-alanine acetyltransferase